MEQFCVHNVEVLCTSVVLYEAEAQLFQRIKSYFCSSARIQHQRINYTESSAVYFLLVQLSFVPQVVRLPTSVDKKYCDRSSVIQVL
jgi:hypothetical protein